MEKIPEWETDRVGNGSHLWGKRHDNQATAARGGDEEGAAATILRGGVVHIDATYWGHNWGEKLAQDEESVKPL